MIPIGRRGGRKCDRPDGLAEIGLELIDVFLRVREGELPEGALAARPPVFADVQLNDPFQQTAPALEGRCGK